MNKGMGGACYSGATWPTFGVRTTCEDTCTGTSLPSLTMNMVPSCSAIGGKLAAGD